jgi:hypothetical protein
MAGFRPFGSRGGVPADRSYPGDTTLNGESLQNLGTVGAALWTGALIAGGLINRTGSTAAFNDTTDSAANILAALAGNGPSADVTTGTSWRMDVQNTVAFALTLSLGAGVIAGLGSLNIPASSVREYLLTVLSPQVPATVNATTTNGSAVVNWVLPPNQVALPEGASPLALNVQTGATATGTGIPANTTVIGILAGQGGTIGVTLSANATATNAAGTPITFGPTIKMDAVFSTGL